ncbi:hypothetical protein TWF106_001407 [Orbilia oligospora]|uniref:Uncharacterized protein n=1 Tax=Orbilia oligospora TaxID=2813651 RepID=A0A6G1LV16_ORBOL|nr:hypothetical protein TWF788_003484 [Orbilia oligospora]KAF3204914.1 hypothetical protein TWF106_001407 [Orbilia oligospora]KAF3211744.1 hypothetical protein TWF679_006237 [Orbilia oligospora]KAF3225491.1 hypothetical protein TWF191_005198 [Orbilia oligospora]KAF3234395.1 hypothetical protein TWF192_001530 [Orbilia oligospora]
MTSSNGERSGLLTLMNSETVKTAGVINRTRREVDKDQQKTKKKGSGIFEWGGEKGRSFTTGSDWVCGRINGKGHNSWLAVLCGSGLLSQDMDKEAGTNPLAPLTPAAPPPPPR